VPPYSAHRGGVVVAAAVQLFAHAEVVPRAAGYRLVSDDIGRTLELDDEQALGEADELPLLRAGLRMLPPGPSALSTRSDAPPGSGLGSSGALDVAIVAALADARGEQLDRRAVAELACRLEAVEAGIAGGRQDQFVAAYGGFLRLEFHDPAATVEPLAVEPAFAAELERRMLLCYTGASRFSGATITRVMRAFESGDAEVARALDGLREVAERTAEALREGDLAAFGRLLSENWRLQQRLDPAMSTPEMARLEAAMGEAGALGGKAAGSGAGGSMFFLGPDDPRRAAEAVRALGMRLLPVRWADSGVRSC
jgi:D-glycero-alpha-D-manno-heptose-7-phosphate kinase